MPGSPNHIVPIRDDYQVYRPPHWVKKTVIRLLESLSSAHVGALAAVVLTDSSKVGKGRAARVRGRKYWLKQCLGYYTPAHAREPAAVFLVVDNIMRDRRHLHWVQFVRDAMLADVLYHEIGHHLHSTVGSHADGRETSADAWQRRLWRIHLRRRYWYLRPLAPVALVLARALRRRHARRRR